MVSTECLGVIEAVCNRTRAIGLVGVTLIPIMELTCGQFDTKFIIIRSRAGPLVTVIKL